MTDPRNEITEFTPKSAMQAVDIEDLKNKFGQLWEFVQDLPEESQIVEANQLLVDVFQVMQSLETQSDDLFQKLQVAAELFADMRFQRDITLEELEKERKRRHENEKRHILSDMGIMNNITPTQAKRFLDALTGDTTFPLDEWTREELIETIEKVEREVFEDEMYHADAEALAKIDFEKVD